MRLFRSVLLPVVLASACLAQMTPAQKTTDFLQLVGLYAKNYAPYEWKKIVFGYDLLDVKPWLDQVEASKNDLEFYDICVRYVAALNDSHDEFILPSDFIAYLNFDVDIYEGKLLIEYISRSALPSSRFRFQVGDELVMVDGKTVEELITAYLPYAANGAGNPDSRRRLAADAITYRVQAYMPRAHEVGETSSVVVRRANGSLETYDVPWTKTGVPLTFVGPVPGPRLDMAAGLRPARVARPRTRPEGVRERDGRRPGRDAWGERTGPAPEPEIVEIPEYLKPLRELQEMGADTTTGFGGFGDIFPVYAPPLGFRIRLGLASSDNFLTGTFTSGGKTLGLIRIPTMSPANTTTALNQFASEIAYMQANTSGLIIDVMRNGGGSLCYIEQLAQFLMTRPFRGSAYEMRATQTWVRFYSSAISSAKANRADQWVIDLYTAYLNQVMQALAENRGLTGSLPVCRANWEDIPPATNAAGASLAYSKPIVVLVDGFTLSAAETFTAFLQDEQRALIYGTRTDGGGGNPASLNATSYSEGTTRVTRTLVTRKAPVVTPGFPASHYLENVGVYPDVVKDIMTEDEFWSGGEAFFGGAVAELLRLIN